MKTNNQQMPYRSLLTPNSRRMYVAGAVKNKGKETEKQEFRKKISIANYFSGPNCIFQP
ncbi:hypothetical protein [Flavihumibacter sp. ZG627]|uniref:hypothetical protein n=1 Tax=Flavihumibacter sp. ZG627 TaxID=1463156 RepID=UPI0012E04DCF|nr:hypothetical protein [Flavihumibacter sp. ZG627]